MMVNDFHDTDEDQKPRELGRTPSPDSLTPFPLAVSPHTAGHWQAGAELGSERRSSLHDDGRD